MSDDTKTVKPQDIKVGTEILFNVFNGDALLVESVQHVKSQGVVEFRGTRKSDGKKISWQVFDKVEFSL